MRQAESFPPHSRVPCHRRQKMSIGIFVILSAEAARSSPFRCRACHLMRPAEACQICAEHTNLPFFSRSTAYLKCARLCFRCVKLRQPSAIPAITVTAAQPQASAAEHSDAYKQGDFPDQAHGAQPGNPHSCRASRYLPHSQQRVHPSIHKLCKQDSCALCHRQIVEGSVQPPKPCGEVPNHFLPASTFHFSSGRRPATFASLPKFVQGWFCFLSTVSVLRGLSEVCCSAC